ncbi:hypothetical protein GQF61_05850 [Sphingobacterium sp. DK4209]|uniref:Lipoprotein n=1 Tax=Sphingobacterium zhuxiongii TaxID=2662364 RepID=A0A5Q0QB26_9SPHI|nr:MULTISPECIES: hypothetical protein [unclassified Sphingobacterium]MVZ65371.1 hypothetical protein [Sphingobacterium sp. DK4209]QGA26454.1 hypothetical protein GFH32_08990 [Sphingobacterium sp. dk4302]
MYRKIVKLMISAFLFSAFIGCDYFAAGSNLMAERYEYEVSKDSLMQKINTFNILNGVKLEGHTFKISKNNPNFYRGTIYDHGTDESYIVLIPKPIEPPTSLLLVSLIDNKSGKIIIVNQKPSNNQEIIDRGVVIRKFEDRILDKLGLEYHHTGNAMNKKYE